MEEKQLSEKESLKIITEMIGKTRGHFHESGTSAILWGSIIAICGLVSFSELKFNWYPGFDIWWLTIAALVPQALISISESRKRTVVSYNQAAVSIIWIIYVISIFGLIFYLNVVPSVTARAFNENGIKSLQVSLQGTKAIHFFIPSNSSLFLLIYAIPTLATGLIFKFRPMVYGAILCYCFFITSCFVSDTWDMLLNGTAGIFNWLIPGIILRRKYFSLKKRVNV